MIFRISKIQTLVALLLLSFHALDDSIFVNSYPSGAGSCSAGIAALDGFHLAKAAGKSVKLSKFSDKSVNITIGGITVMPGEVITLASNTLHMINVTSSGMQGVLIRLEAPKGVKTTGVLTPGSSTHTATVCIDPIVGITHKIPSVVENYDGIINFPSPTDGVLFDITVVFSASDTLSEYAYGNFTVNFVSSAPVAMPVIMPASTSLSKPVGKPVGTPISMPVGKPISKAAAATSVSKPANKARINPVGKPLETTVSKPISKPITKAIGKPILKEEKVDVKPISKPIKKSFGKPILKEEEVDVEEEKHDEEVHHDEENIEDEQEGGKVVDDKKKKPIMQKETTMATKNNS